jgi:hypothetical protein
VAIFFYNTLQCEVLLTEQNKLKKPILAKPMSGQKKIEEVGADYLRNLSHSH